MSSSDRRPHATRHPTRRGAIAGFAMLATLAGCTVQPLYMPVAGNRYSNVDLSKITIGPVSDRVAQQVRNNLVFAFTGGKTPPPPEFVLTIEVKSSEQRLGFTQDETAPSYQVTVEVRFDIKTIADDRSILRSVSRASASYDRSNQNFANERARFNAENRAAQSVADEISLRLSLAIAKNKAPANVTIPTGPNLPAGATPSILGNSM
jgi:LPS-assembly lipoprotein